MQFNAILKIEIVDKPIQGYIYLLNWQGQKAAVCFCRDKYSSVCVGEEEEKLYFSCREWFMEQFDGFVKVEKLVGDEENKGRAKFKEIAHLFK